jgi:hypothetical protein
MVYHYLKILVVNMIAEQLQSCCIDERKADSQKGESGNRELAARSKKQQFIFV